MSDHCLLQSRAGGVFVLLLVGAISFAPVRGGRGALSSTPLGKAVEASFQSEFNRQPAGVARARLGESYGTLPLTFEINRGQTDGAVKFLSRANGYVLFLTADETVMVFENPAAHDRGKERRGARESGNGRGPKPPRPVVRMRLEGAATAPTVEGLEELPGRSNYFGGDDPARWHTSVEHYARVRYSQVYPGVDLIYYGNRRRLEYDFVVAPGGDPGLIRLNFSGPEKVEVNAEGDLSLRVAGGWLRQQRPVVYQDVDGVRLEIPSRYVLGGDNSVGFQVGAYDAARPLIIDPVLVYSSYLGGSGFDQGYGVAVDAGRNAYVTGQTAAIDFPTTPGAFQTSYGGGDAFVTKINPAGNALVYSTFLGGGRFLNNTDDWGEGIAVDSAGSAYVTGYTYAPDFPVTPGAFDTSWNGLDVFVSKFTPEGTSLVYSTFLGGTQRDQGLAVAVDAGGNAYVTGATESEDSPFTPEYEGFPVTPGAFQTRGSFDAFVTKLNVGGSALIYSTYLGGSADVDRGWGIAVDSFGNAYVTGDTKSAGFPVLNAIQQQYGGGLSDAFVAELNATGSALVYSTFLGGSLTDEGRGIAVDSSGNAYATGDTSSFDFPTAGAFQGSNGGGQNNHDDAYVVKIGNTSPAPAPTPTPTPTPTPAPTPAADTVAIQRAEYAASRRQLRVNATSTSPTATLKAYVTATGAFIGTLDGRGGKYSGQFSWPTNPQNITVRSSLGGSASAPVIVK